MIMLSQPTQKAWGATSSITNWRLCRAGYTTFCENSDSFNKLAKNNFFPYHFTLTRTVAATATASQPNILLAKKPVRDTIELYNICGEWLLKQLQNVEKVSHILSWKLYNLVVEIDCNNNGDESSAAFGESHWLDFILSSDIVIDPLDVSHNGKADEHDCLNYEDYKDPINDNIPEFPCVNPNWYRVGDDFEIDAFDFEFVLWEDPTDGGVGDEHIIRGHCDENVDNINCFKTFDSHE
jgi:hypothetical protein